MRINSEEAIALGIALRRMSQIPAVDERELIDRLIGKLETVSGGGSDLLEVSQPAQISTE